jgi:glycosyltransferase involved in cell wall biosynthesis
VVEKLILAVSSINEKVESVTETRGSTSAKQGISIIIPAYNPDVDDIRGILNSLDNQEYQNFEVLIANDGLDFSSKIADILYLKPYRFHYKNNPRQLGLYGSIQENIKYCKFDRILILEQDILPLSPKYLACLVELVESSPKNVVTSKLVIDADTDYKKYVFYKRRIANLVTFDRAKSDGQQSNQAQEVEIAFTKADLLDKTVLSELFSKGSDNTFTAQDIILTSIVQKNKRLVTSDATACEIGCHDPNKLSFFLKKEFLYGRSVLDVLRHSNKQWLSSTNYFWEKASRVMFIGVESVTVFILLLDILLGGALLVPLLMLIFGLGVFYTQAVLFSIGFWPFWYKGSRKLSVALGSGFYVSLLDLSYSLGVLRGLL